MENLVMQLEEYYTNKKVFVTGHTGFKGAWLCAVLNTLNAQLKGYALTPEFENNLYNIIQPSIKINSVIADIRNKNQLQKEILNSILLSQMC